MVTARQCHDSHIFFHFLLPYFLLELELLWGIAIGNCIKVTRTKIPMSQLDGSSCVLGSCPLLAAGHWAYDWLTKEYKS